MSGVVVRAQSVDEALAVLAGGPEPACVLAGGTDLMVAWRQGVPRPGLVVDLSRVDGLRGIEVAGGELRVGALTTCAELLRSAVAREHADLLVAAAGEVGAAQIQSRATVGGNLGSASPAADLAPALWVLGARVVLRSAARGRREVPVAEFFTGYRRTARRPDELIEAVVVPPREPDERRAFRKVGTRRAQSISKLVVATALTVRDGVVVGVRAAAGSVAPRTVELVTLARELEGRSVSEQNVGAAVAASIRADVAPIDDVRSTAAYRRAVLGRVLTTMLTPCSGQER